MTELGERNKLLRDELERSEDGRRIAEAKLEASQGVVRRNAQALAGSLEKSRALEEELSQLRRVAQSMVKEVLGPRPEPSALAADLMEVLGEVRGLVSDGVFHGA